jgi:DNA-binding NtrC family response regulator
MKSAVRAYKRRLVERAIGASAGDNAEAARRLGVNPKYLYQLVRDLELSVDGNAPASDREVTSSSYR